MILALTLLACGVKVDHRPLVRAGSDHPIFFQDTTVFTGTGDVLPHTDVLTRDGRIHSVEPTGKAPPGFARVVDGKGATLMPGFVETHAHIGGSGSPPWYPIRADVPHNLQAWLYAGVTTVFDVGGNAPDTIGWRDKVQRGELLGPRLFVAHMPITGPGGHPIPVGRSVLPFPLSAMVGRVVPQAASPGDAPRLVDEAIAKGAEMIKITCDQIPPGSPQLDYETLGALVATAHERGLPAGVHIGSAQDALAAARADADVLLHGVYRGTVSRQQASIIADYHVPMVVTVAGFDNLADITNGHWQPTPMTREIASQELLENLEGEIGSFITQQGALGEFAVSVVGDRDQWPKNIRTLHEAGVPLLVGTDAVLPGVVPGASYHQEMATLVAAGVPNMDVLLGATGRAATMLNDDVAFGTIQAGKAADLVLLDGDPLTDIAATERLKMVVVGGREIERLAP